MIRTLVIAPLALAAMTSSALAHFHLDQPTSTIAQAANGDPQKAGPCGGVGTATNAVTNYTPGQMIDITVDETVNHPGHYRVALAPTEADLPAPPPVTAGGGKACGSAPIDANPVMPILADGLFVALTQTDPAATTKVKLPDGMSCPNCVLQVIEFMSDHDAPCFYYHCAKVNIVAGAPDAGPPTGGGGGTPDASTGNGNTGGGETSGGCSTSSGAGLGLGLALLGLVIRRRRP